MNENRRARLRRLVDDLDQIINEEQGAHDNLPESIQSSERGDAMQEQIDRLTEAKEALEEVQGE